MSESVSSQNKRILDALRTVIDLPDRVTSLDLSVRMDDVPRIDVSFVGMPPRADPLTEKQKAAADVEFWSRFHKLYEEELAKAPHISCKWPPEDKPMTEEQRQAIQEYWDEFGNHANKYPYSQANDYLG